jgi:hypothetical protein
VLDPANMSIGELAAATEKGAHAAAYLFEIQEPGLASVAAAAAAKAASELARRLAAEAAKTDGERAP